MSVAQGIIYFPHLIIIDMTGFIREYLETPIYAEIIMGNNFSESNYTEFSKRGGLSGKKGKAQNEALGLRTARLHANLCEEAKKLAVFYAEKADLTLSEFVLRLITSKEADNFVNKISINKKGKAQNEALGLRTARLHVNLSQEAKKIAVFYAKKADLSLSEFVLRLIKSKEAENFVNRISVHKN